MIERKSPFHRFLWDSCSPIGFGDTCQSSNRSTQSPDALPTRPQANLRKTNWKVDDFFVGIKFPSKETENITSSIWYNYHHMLSLGIFVYVLRNACLQ
ncbi:hypothetical protein NPIL_160941 [Nephila pilipes]|uniref:Uncharacterized protein n=1 Tax=Nephila pilipes TaxID=299642 RepID=A0A8X6TGH0_NEPPI|nr:hypothetical protein NPIL_160941 [Nephila pilipes]